MKKIKLFVFDLDGTALDSNQRPYARFSPVFCSFLDEISQEGILWSINSTWDVDAQWDLVLSSPVQSRPVFLMGGLGKKLARVGKSEIEMVEEYNSKIQKRVEKHAKDIVSIMKEMVQEFYPEKIHFYGHLFSFTVIEKETEKLQSYIQNKISSIPRTIKLYASKNGVIVTHSFLNKGEILSKVEKMLNITPDEVAVAGDSIFDISMMTKNLARYIICPSNAEKKVKEIARKNGGVVASKPFYCGVFEGYRMCQG
ncbi:MAG: HAD hydrolase family protein [Candidatus Omnitrophica bacterium]|nr:HAD hydrolase family protein [Candidatus Omnitrophota bacterium]